MLAARNGNKTAAAPRSHRVQHQFAPGRWVRIVLSYEFHKLIRRLPTCTMKEGDKGAHLDPSCLWAKVPRSLHRNDSMQLKLSFESSDDGKQNI